MSSTREMVRVRDAVICSPLRSPVGRFGGALRDLPARALAIQVLRALLEQTRLSGKAVDEVILGQAYPGGEEPAIGRVVALDTGLPLTTTGLQVDRRCGSGLQAVIDAAMRVQLCVADLVVAGGTESMSSVEHYATGLRWGGHADHVLADRLARARLTAGGESHPIEGGMLETAENLRREFSISREDQDGLALRSHQRAVAAHREGRFDAEIVAIEVPDRRRGTAVVDRDEHPREDATLEALAGLRPIRVGMDEEATVTAGNASGQNDGAALCIVTHPDRAEALGLRPLVRLAGWAVAGVEPERMGIGPVPATELALERAGLAMEDLGLIELNEAFAAQALAVTRSWGLADDDDLVNPNGSGISLGHPVGATGARILATLVHELHRRDERFALETMCIGGGQGIAAVFERIS